MRVVFRSWSLAVQISVRERLEALCEKLKSQTDNGPVTLATMRKHQLVEAAPLWSRDRAEQETVGQLRLALRELRQEKEELQPERKRLLPHGWKRFQADEIKELAMERNIPVCGPDGKTKVKEALIRDLLRWCERQPEVEASPLGACRIRASRPDNQVGTEQSRFTESKTEPDERGDLHDSNGTESRTTIWAVFGSSRVRTTRRVLFRTWEPGGGMPRQEVGTNCTELKEKFPREQPVAAGQQRRRQRCACQFVAVMALHLGTHLAQDGGWRQIKQLCDVIELFSTDALVSLAVSSVGGRATQPHDGGLGNS